MMPSQCDVDRYLDMIVRAETTTICCKLQQMVVVPALTIITCNMISSRLVVADY